MKYVIWTVGGLLGLVVFATGCLWLYGLRRDAGVMRAQETIAATPDELWPWLRDGEKLKSWVGWMVEVRTPDAGADGFGSRQTWVMEDRNNNNQRMSIEARVAEMEKPKRFVMAAATPGMFNGQHIYTLTPVGDRRTRLEVEGRYTFEYAVARLLEPLITNSAEKKLVTDLARLRSRVEARKATAAAHAP